MPVISGYATTATGASWTSPANAQGAPNATSASITWSGTSSAALTLSGFFAANAIPAGAVVTRITFTTRASGNSDDTLRVTPSLSSSARTARDSGVLGVPLADYPISGTPDQWGMTDLSGGNVSTLACDLTARATAALSYVSGVDAALCEIEYAVGGFRARALGRGRGR